MFNKPTVFSDESGSHVLGKDGSIKASFTIADHGASHEGAAVSHLQQNFDSYMGESSDLPWDEDPKNPTRKSGERKDEYGNKVKNVAKYLAKKAMNKQKNEEVEDLEEVNKYSVHKGKQGWFVNQHTDNGVWHHSVQTGYHDSKEKAVAWAKKHAAGREHKIDIREEIEDLDETAKIVAHLQKRYGDNIRKSHVRSAANDFGVDASKLAKAVRTKLGKNMLDEEQIDELSVAKLDQYRTKARKDIIDTDETDEKRIDKRASGYLAASRQVAKKLAKEEVEQVDEDKNLHWMDNEDKGSEAKKRTPVEHKARYKKLVKDAEQFEKHSAIHSYAKNRALAYKNYHNVNEEAVKNPYAVGMAAAMKSTGDTPPLKKSTIIKAHKIAKEVMENKFLAGAIKKLEEGRGRPPKEGSAAYLRQQAAQEPDEEPEAIGMQLRKAKSINKPVTFFNKEVKEIHPKYISAFNDHMAHRRTTQEKHAFQKKASASHDAFVKAVSEPLPAHSKDTGEIIRYRH